LSAAQDLEYLLPTVRTQIRGLRGVVQGGKQNSGTPQSLEVPRPVIDQDVGVDDVLGSAKHDPAGGDERKMPSHPFELVREWGVTPAPGGARDARQRSEVRACA